MSLQFAFAFLGSALPEDAKARVMALLERMPGCRLQAVEPGSSPLPATAHVALIVAPCCELAACCSLLAQMRQCWPAAPVLVFVDRLDSRAPPQLAAAGACDFAALSAQDAELTVRLERAMGRQAMVPAAPPAAQAGAAPSAGRWLRSQLLGRSPALTQLLARLPAVSRSNLGVLLLGETGTGKEVCAQSIHYGSARAQGPWVTVNCAAIPAELVEDELFGHVRGAYTHASSARAGLVQEAEGGTLLLDEIDSLPLGAQAKLLRFLQEREYRPVGSSRLQRADVRVIAASNRDLALTVRQGRFRQDLYFRLNVLTLTLPPLRERREDIPLLAGTFFEEMNREAGHRLAGIAPAAMARLIAHDWPGNVRELKNVIQGAMVMAAGPSLQAGDIDLCGEAQGAPAAPLSFREAKAQAVEAFERGYLERLLADAEGNISAAARAARKNRRAFFELMRRYDIDASRYRDPLSTH